MIVFARRLTAPPRDGEANAELIETLSDVFRVPKSSMAVTAGFKSRSKTVTIAGLDADTAARVLSAASDKK